MESSIGHSVTGNSQIRIVVDRHINAKIFAKPEYYFGNQLGPPKKGRQSF